MRSLLLCNSEESYSSQLADEVKKWPENFAQYFPKSTDPVIRQKLGRWLVGNYGAFDPYSGLTTNQSEGFNTVMKVCSCHCIYMQSPHSLFPVNAYTQIGMLVKI